MFQPERGDSCERSRGGSSAEHFVHVSDVESDFVPLKGDQVSSCFSLSLSFLVFGSDMESDFVALKGDQVSLSFWLFLFSTPAHLVLNGLDFFRLLSLLSL